MILTNRDIIHQPGRTPQRRSLASPWGLGFVPLSDRWREGISNGKALRIQKFPLTNLHCYVDFIYQKGIGSISIEFMLRYAVYNVYIYIHIYIYTYINTYMCLFIYALIHLQTVPQLLWWKIIGSPTPVVVLHRGVWAVCRVAWVSTSVISWSCGRHLAGPRRSGCVVLGMTGLKVSKLQTDQTMICRKWMAWQWRALLMKLTFKSPLAF